MKVILLKDVAKIGRRSEVVDVPNGYALNQLIPKKMAEIANPASLRRIEQQEASKSATNEANLARFEAAHKSLTEKNVQISTEVNDKGHLFKAVSEADIVEAAAAAGIDIEASMVSIVSPIKTAGEHTVELVGGGKKAEFKIEVIKK